MNKKVLLTAVLAALLQLSPDLCSSMMIESSRIAFVNVRKVFREMERVRKTKNELDEIIQRKKLEIEETEQAIASVRKKIDDAEKTRGFSIPRAIPEPVPSADVSDSTSSAVSLPAPPEPAPARDMPGFSVPASEISEYKRLLSDQEESLKTLIDESKEMILQKDQALRIKVMGQIYDVIDNIAKEEGYTVVLDREAIILSSGSAMEITDEVIRRLNAKSY